MIDKSTLQDLLRRAFEAGRDQGMEDIEAILSQRPSARTPDEAFEAFLKNEATEMNRLTNSQPD